MVERYFMTTWLFKNELASLAQLVVLYEHFNDQLIISCNLYFEGIIHIVPFWDFPHISLSQSNLSKPFGNVAIIAVILYYTLNKKIFMQNEEILYLPYECTSVWVSNSVKEKHLNDGWPLSQIFGYFSFFFLVCDGKRC